VASLTEKRDPVAGLLKRLQLEALDRDLYLGDPGRGQGRLFGGLVAAQTVVAAFRTLPDPAESRLHSLHAYFLRPGSYGKPIRLVVDRIRDGRTFTTRRVVAHQGGEAIFNLSASFARHEEGLSHQAPMPDAPAPDDLPSWHQLRSLTTGDDRPMPHEGPVDVRVCDPSEFQPGHQPSLGRMVWMRMQAKLPDDPVAHAACLVYASDRTMLSTALRPANIIPGSGYMAASLDHAMWFHHPPRFDDWILYSTESPIAHAARGLILGAMFTADGTQIGSVVQEGLIRLTGTQPAVPQPER
jgi:acyl-CoA thioesterase-2